jgi:hypothetical protein
MLELVTNNLFSVPGFLVRLFGLQLIYPPLSAPQKDSCHLYLDQTLSSLPRLQSPGTLSRFFFTATHQRGVSASRLSYGFLSAIATTWRALCF